MTLDLFRVIKGLSIQSDDLTTNVSILHGSGVPGGDGAEQDAAPRGSLYLRTDATADGQQLYWKAFTTNNSSADWNIVADRAYVDAVVQGLSWREPVRVLDSSEYVDTTEFPTTGTVDGVTLNAGDRVLFTNVSESGSKNVFVWDGEGWSEDSNAESNGDAVFVQSGSFADTQWVFNGADWVLIGSTSNAAELSFLRAFVGKTGTGSEMPSYSSTDIVTQSESLEVAISELDEAVGSIGVAVGNRTYSEENVVTSNQSVTASIDTLDSAIGVLQAQDRTLSASNVTASDPVTVDSLPLIEATQAKWLVQVRETSTPANRRSVEVYAINDGSSLVDYTEFGVLTLGSAIDGFNIDVDISGTDMRLRLTATNNIDYVVKRIAYSSF